MQASTVDLEQPPHSVTLTAPSRLHFGLLRVGRGERRFGGAGVMVDRPALRLRGQAAENWRFEGALAERVEEFSEAWRRSSGLSLPPIQIQVLDAPPQHSGLGVGTQLGLAVAAMLNTFAGLPLGGPEALARTVNRGRRSAVGAYGFHLGGLIIERGKSEHEFLSPLDLQVDLPTTWRFLLVRPRSEAPTVFGAKEQSVFSQLTAQPKLESELESILRERLAPAAATGAFEAFASAVEDYGLRSGSYFADAQGGAFNGEQLNGLAKAMKANGAVGVGQSSWGPTLFSCHADIASAQGLQAWLKKQDEFGPLDIEITAVNRGGASIESTANHPSLRTS